MATPGHAVLAALPVRPALITRFFMFAPLECHYEDDLMEKLVDEQLPFSWQLPRPVSLTIIEALHAAAKVVTREQSKKRSRGDDDEPGGPKFPLSTERLLLEITIVDPKLPLEQITSVMLTGATF
jgi:hypothetical protein